MKFGRAYTIYVQTEVPQIMPHCPFVEFKRLKKVLKRCPHLVVVSPDGTDAVSCGLDGVSCVPSDGTTSTSDFGATAALQRAMSSEDDDHSGISTTAIARENPCSSAVIGKPHAACSACDTQFFPQLDKAVSEVVGCFKTCAEDLLSQHMASGLRKYFIWLRKKFAGDNVSMAQVGNMLVSYGCMNSLAIRKILKKYDKIHSSESGREFKSRLQVRRMELLQSPLLIELAALAINLMSAQAPGTPGPPPPQPPPPSRDDTCTFDDENETITYSLRDGVRLDFELTCPICLEVVFDPVALSCGHIFCNSCACTAAAVSMVDGVNAARRNQKCPLCRQIGVYPDAVPMGELHILVSERCSSYYNERLPAEREKRILDAKLHWESQTQRILRM